MTTVAFFLNISASDYLKWYQGYVGYVQVKATDGQRIRFPANILRPFVTRTGVHGLFEITFDADKKFRHIKRMS